MKNLLLLLFVSVLSFGANAQMLTDFDANQNVTLEGWPNNPTIVANPSASGINTSANCAKFQRSTETWANVFANLSSPFDFTTNNTFKAKVYCPYACDLVFKLESSTGTAPVEVHDSCDVANQWVEVEFGFSGIAASGVYDKFTFFLDFATNNDTVFYIDDIEFVPGVVMNQIDLPLDFESSNTVYSFVNFGGTETVVGTDPVSASNTVAVSTKTVGAADWAGVTVGTEAGFASPIPFTSVDTKISMDVYSPAVGMPILFKLEVHTNTAIAVETQMLTTVANAWETIEFDFSNHTAGDPLNLANPYNKAVIFFDFGTAGAGDVFYWDNVHFISTGLGQITLPVTFEASNIDYTMVDFGGMSSLLGADPVVAGNTVGISTKTAGADTWAGVVVGTDSGFVAPVPFSAVETKMRLDVYSPAVGMSIIFKLEVHSNTAISVETEMLTTVANAWETIEFDFSNHVANTDPLDIANAYNKAVLFFDYGNTGAGDVFYFDNMMFVPAVLGAVELPITFDDPLVDYTFESWGDNHTVLGVDPVNPNNNVAFTTKPATGATWAGSAVIGISGGLGTAIPFSSTETTMSMKVYSPAAGIPILMKVEDKADGSHSCETLMSTTVANAWETIVFDFTNEVMGTPALDLSWTYDKVAVFFDFDNTGVEQVFYWDDVAFEGAAHVSALEENRINIFPNPVNDVLTIDGLKNNESVKIFNVLGELVLSNNQVNSTSTSINVSHLTNGIYIVAIQDAKGMISSKRLIKN